MTQARKPRTFSSTEHLASEAVAAYVDGELRMNAYLRAADHLAECPECAFEVETQQQARRALQSSADVCMPNSLLGILSQIPSCGAWSDGPVPGHGDRSRLASISSVVSARLRRH